MKLELKPHPDARPGGASRVAVEVLRPRPRVLQLRYRVLAEAGALRAPPPAPSVRTDGLWRHTCLEAFIRPPDGEAYYELNFSPSSQWAAYRFAGYRSGMSQAGIPAPTIEVRSDERGLELYATADLAALADLPEDRPWRLGLSAVIEAADGSIAYWALAHPPGRPDFHHADCFAGELVAAGAS
jgi:hypothetical protein